MFRVFLLILISVSVLAAQAPAGAAAAREAGLYATFNTTQGKIVVKLFEQETPVTVKNFVALARGTKAWPDPKTGQAVKRPFYNGITFHRVIPGFMIQFGDPTATGTYGPKWTIPDEFVPTLKFDQPGRLAMANTGSRNTGNVQAFLTDGLTPHLNGQHTIFGQVVEGMDVVSAIARVPRDASDKPRTPVRITTLVIQREGPAPAGASPAVKKAVPKKAVK
jgi:cyclophilin family peptidyl-prolyl cis-trans isomerase